MDTFEKIIVTLGALFILGMVYGFINMYRYKAACLAYGYPQMEYANKAYCIKRVNQTDVVVPLSELEER